MLFIPMYLANFFLVFFLEEMANYAEPIHESSTPGSLGTGKINCDFSILCLLGTDIVCMKCLLVLPR